MKQLRTLITSFFSQIGFPKILDQFVVGEDADSMEMSDLTGREMGFWHQLLMAEKLLITLLEGDDLSEREIKDYCDKYLNNGQEDASEKKSLKVKQRALNEVSSAYHECSELESLVSSLQTLPSSSSSDNLIIIE